jgi:hypothetical protein
MRRTDDWRRAHDGNSNGASGRGRRQFISILRIAESCSPVQSTSIAVLAESPFPLPLAFVVLPLTLHPATRRVLPGRADTTLASWSAAHHAILSEMSDRVMRLRPVTREALLFLAQIRAIAVHGDGISPGSSPLKLSARLAVSTPEVDETRRAAGLLGRWFAHQATTATVLQTMGVRL